MEKLKVEAPEQDFSQTLYKVDKDEKVLAVIKRHPFGILKLYAQVFLGLAAAGGLVYSLLPEIINAEQNPDIYAAVALVGLLVVGFMLVITLIATIIYYQSKLVVTDKTITQIIQTSLFSNKTSQLAISSIEDVTAHKSGFFPTIFNYGRLLVETAGEQENFHFDYCPHSEHYAKLILETRQQFMGRREAELREEQHGYAFAQNVAGSSPATTGPVTSTSQRPIVDMPAVRMTPVPEDINTTDNQKPADQPSRNPFTN